MARKKKGELPSGNIRIKVYDYTDTGGKKHYQSFTAPTRSEAQAMAAEWKAGKRQIKQRTTIYQCCESFVSAREAVLSPSTIRGYKSILKVIKGADLASVDIRTISNNDLQRFVSELSVGHSPKYVKNVFAVISSSLAVSVPDFNHHVKFGQKAKTETYVPTNEDVQKLIDCCTTPEEKLGILFGAVCFMRRGEACAVEFSDYKDGMIHISKSMVMSSDHCWVTKAPKTFDSDRYVAVPGIVESLIDSLGRKDGQILGMNPQQLYEAFRKALRRAELPDFRYHDLRHHAASYAHSLNISDRYVEKMGGWRPNSTVLRRIYEHTIDQEMKKAQKAFLESQKYSV